MAKKPICDDNLMIVRLPQEDRRQAWIDNPPRPMPIKVTPNSSLRFAPINSAASKTPAISDKEGGKDEKPTPPKPTTKKKVSRKGLVDMHVIASELGISPKEARGILRKLKIPKPPQGWAFPADEVDGIKVKIKSYEKPAPKAKGRPIKAAKEQPECTPPKTTAPKKNLKKPSPVVKKSATTNPASAKDKSPKKAQSSSKGRTSPSRTSGTRKRK